MPPMALALGPGFPPALPTLLPHRLLLPPAKPSGFPPEPAWSGTQRRCFGMSGLPGGWVTPTLALAG